MSRAKPQRRKVKLKEREKEVNASSAIDSFSLITQRFKMGNYSDVDRLAAKDAKNRERPRR